MPTYRYGNMLDHHAECDLFCVTTSATLDQNYNLVMGAGIAGKMKERYPSLPQKLGQRLREVSCTPDYNENHEIVTVNELRPVRNFWIAPDYGVLVSENWPNAKLLPFQSKREFWLPSDLELIVASCRNLVHLLKSYPKQNPVVFLNCPGTGNGGLNFNDVKLVLDEFLPDNVVIWRHAIEKLMDTELSFEQERPYAQYVVNIRNVPAPSEEYVYVGRKNDTWKMPMSIFCNPFPMKREYQREKVIEKYRKFLNGDYSNDASLVNAVACSLGFSDAETWRQAILQQIPALRGKKLVCWCSPKHCHAEVLAEIANQ